MLRHDMASSSQQENEHGAPHTQPRAQEPGYDKHPILIASPPGWSRLMGGGLDMEFEPLG